MKTKIQIWSKLGHTPITKRKGAFYDLLLEVDLDCETPAHAAEETRRLIKETEHGDNGHFYMIDHPNQNTRSQFINRVS